MPSLGTTLRLDLRPLTEPAVQTGRLATEDWTQPVAARRLYIIGIGSAGKLVCLFLHAFAHQDGFRFVIRALDTDHRLPDPVVLANGTQLQLSTGSFLGFGVPEPRHTVLDLPELYSRYAAQLETIPVIDTYGRGDGGYPVMSALQFELAMGQIRPFIESGFQEALGAPVVERRGLKARLAEHRSQKDAPDLPVTILIVGGGCGSVGAAGHILVPYLVRAIARDRGEASPYQIGAVFGPHIYRDLTPRTQSNWGATVGQLDGLSHTGMTGPLAREFRDGTLIDDPAPPYQRIIMADQKPTRQNNNEAEAELRSFYAQVAKNLYTLITSDALDRMEAAAINNPHPWTTLQGVLARADLDAVVSQAATVRARTRLERLAGIA